jgi:hypothetical protein
LRVVTALSHFEEQIMTQPFSQTLQRQHPYRSQRCFRPNRKTMKQTDFYIKFPNEPTFDTEIVHDQQHLFQKYIKMKIITYSCLYCKDKGRRGGPQIEGSTAKMFLKTLLKDIDKDYESIGHNMQPKYDFVIDGITITIVSTELSYAEIRNKIFIAKLKEMIESDPLFKTEFDMWLKTVKLTQSSKTETISKHNITITATVDSSAASFVKAGAIRGLSQLGFQDTKYIAGHGGGPVNHMNGADSSILLYTFDWPSVRALIYLYAYYPDFSIGIMREDHCHGN